MDWQTVGILGSFVADTIAVGLSIMATQAQKDNARLTDLKDTLEDISKIHTEVSVLTERVANVKDQITKVEEVTNKAIERIDREHERGKLH